MQISTWALTRSSSRCQMGRRSRSSALMCRKSRSRLRQVLVGGHRAGRVEGVCGDRGADDVDPVGGRLGLDGGLVAAPGDPPVADVQDEVLGDLALIDDLPGGDTDLVRVLDPPGGDPGGDLAQVGLGGGSSSSRVRARLAASNGFRQAISRSPGKSGELISARSCSSNRDSCSGPSPAMSFLIAGWRRQVIHAIPSSSRRSLIRAVVIMPRSPTMIIFSRPNVLPDGLDRLGKRLRVGGVARRTPAPLPAACLSVSSPYSICGLPRLPSREYPNAASSQCAPSTHEQDRSNIAMPPWFRCRAASCFSMSSCRETSQSIAA